MTTYNIPYPSDFKLLATLVINANTSHHITNPSDGTSAFTTFNLMLVNIKTESYIKPPIKKRAWILIINHALCLEKTSKPLNILGFHKYLT